MKEKINVAELLKDCPKGMELDCLLFKDTPVYFQRITNACYYPIEIKVEYPDGTFEIFELSKEGCIYDRITAKCVIFPKGKTTWEGFVPFKDGDIISDSLGTCIFKGEGGIKGTVNYYCGISHDYFRVKDDKCSPNGHYGNIVDYRLATEEEKTKLFKAIEEHGYKWNEETKTLENLVEPKFKVGDKVLWNYDTDVVRTIYKAKYTSNRGYVYWINCDGCSSGWWSENELTPVPDKFDISTLIPFDKVLARHNKDNKWCSSLFSHIDSNLHSHCYRYVTIAGKSYPMCIPYESNEHLLGTTDDCEEFYKTWE